MRDLTFKYVDIITPKPGLVVGGPSYWMCKNGDPKQALFFGKSAQRNTNKSVVEHLLKSNPIYAKLEGIEIVYVEMSFLAPVD